MLTPATGDPGPRLDDWDETVGVYQFRHFRVAGTGVHCRRQGREAEVLHKTEHGRPGGQRPSGTALVQCGGSVRAGAVAAPCPAAGSASRTSTPPSSVPRSSTASGAAPPSGDTGRAGTASTLASRSTVCAGSLPGAQATSATSATSATGTHAIMRSRLISAINIFLRACAIGAEDPLGSMENAMRTASVDPRHAWMKRNPARSQEKSHLANQVAFVWWAVKDSNLGPID
ncbi:hypothetical protein G6F57_015950 [Rhizopus arrhizus]|nr:hypothetical protein G6F57_015950 [Rhizopus arrhizus]